MEKVGKDVYKLALGFLYYVEPDVKVYISTLKEESKYYPELNTLAELLEKTTLNIQDKFISEITRHDQSFIKLILTLTKNWANEPYYLFSRLNINKPNEFSITLVEQADLLTRVWRNNQWYAPIIHKVNNRTIVNEVLAKELLEDLIEINSIKSTGDILKEKGASLIYKTFEFNAITMPKIAIDELINNTSKWTTQTSLAGGFRNLFGITAFPNEKPTGIISAIIMKLNGFKNDRDIQYESKYKTPHAISNPLYTEMNAMRILGQIAAYYSPVVDLSYFDKLHTSETFYY